MKKVIITVFLLSACSSQQRQPSSLSPLEKAGTPSSVEVTFLRGNNARRFLIQRTKEGARIQEYKDQHLLKDISLTGNKPTELLSQSTQVYESIEKGRTKREGPCRTPFALRITNEEKVGTVEGCRNSGEGSVIGQFLSEVEFLISSGSN